MARIAVTGANGFLGSEIVRQLATAGHEPAALVERGASQARLGRLDVERIDCDVRVPLTLERGLRGASCCIHTPGDTAFFRHDRARLVAINVAGTRNVVSAAKHAGVRRLVHTSSVAAIGFDPSGEPADETTAHNWPAGLPYMETKHAGERVAIAAASSDFEVIVLNPATIFGSGPDNPTKLGLVEAIRAKRVFLIPRGGTTICDLTDVAAAHVAALERGRSGQRYILGGPNVAFRELMPALARALGVRLERPMAPPWLLPALGKLLSIPEARGLDIGLPAGALRLSELELYYRSDKAMVELGYRSRPLADIVRRTVVTGADGDVELGAVDGAAQGGSGE